VSAAQQSSAFVLSDAAFVLVLAVAISEPCRATIVENSYGSPALIMLAEGAYCYVVWCEVVVDEVSFVDRLDLVDKLYANVQGNMNRASTNFHEVFKRQPIPWRNQVGPFLLSPIFIDQNFSYQERRLQAIMTLVLAYFSHIFELSFDSQMALRELYDHWLLLDDVIATYVDSENSSAAEDFVTYLIPVVQDTIFEDL
jgi:hypothetical protein